AAHHILRELCPGRAEALGRELRKSLGAIDNQQAAYAAAITGKSIAQIVWAVRAARPGPAPGAAPAFGVDRQPYEIDVRRLNAAVAGLIDSRRLDALDGARVHALAAAAALSARASDGESLGFRVGVAVQSVFDAEGSELVAAAGGLRR